MRRVLGDTLLGLGADDESVYDILLAATEACTNVLTHGGPEVRGYAVVTSVGAVGCQVEVADEGVGLDEGTGLDEGAGLLANADAEADSPPSLAPSQAPPIPETELPVDQLPESGR